MRQGREKGEGGRERGAWGGERREGEWIDGINLPHGRLKTLAALPGTVSSPTYTCNYFCGTALP